MKHESKIYNIHFALCYKMTNFARGRYILSIKTIPYLLGLFQNIINRFKH